MAEPKSTLDDQNKQSNKGANDGRLAPMNDEQREIASKGGKATPALEHDAGLENPSEQPLEGDEASKNGAHKDQSHHNSDDESGARGGIMGGSSTRG